MLGRFLSLVTARPDAAALIDGATGEIITRAALATRGRELASRLTALGLAEGDALALRMPNSPAFVAAILAALELGLVVFPVDRDTTEAELCDVLRIFAIPAIADRDGPRVLPPHPDRQARARFPSGARLVKLSSGSTGRPKGIVTTEANLIADCENICATMGIGPHDRNLGAIPFSHSYGFSNLVGPLLLQGTPVVVSNDYLPQSVLEMANRHACTVAPLIPMVFEHLAAAAHGSFASVRTFISAGAPLAPGTSRRFRERFGIDIHSFYGCSECGGISYDRAGGAVERGTVGEPLDGVGVSLDGDRLCVRSGAVASGLQYDATAFEPFAHTFVTDDLAEMRGNEVALTGRASDLINTAGRKVNPREVEAVLLKIDGVRDVKVWGEPAGARGEVVAAAIVGAPDLTRDQVRRFCQAHLAPHKVPRIIKLIDALPLDDRGKIRRAALAAMQEPARQNRHIRRS